MSVLDLEKLLAPIAEDNLTGDDLEYDAEFMELGRVAQGTPERQMGDSVQPAEDPNWGDVQSRAEELFGRTKDLRVAVNLVRAVLASGGIAGLADGLSLIQQLLDKYWDGIHPRLDPEDDNDPTARVNCMMPLADRAGFVAMIRAIPLVRDPRLGAFSFRDHLIATGEIPPPEGDSPPPDSAQIDGAFHEANLDTLQETCAALDAAFSSAAAIDAGITDRVGASYAPDLSALQQTLREMRNLVAERLSRRGIGTTPESDGSEGGAVTARAAPGEIGSRDDVVAALERVCDYYKRHEQSSPVPLILRRAQRLARMDFMEILRDMAPSGVSEAELIGGAQASSE